MIHAAPGLWALVLLFWSWRTGAWLPGMALAAGCVWAMRTTQRWQLSAASIERLVDLTSLLVLGLLLYEYNRGPLPAAILSVLRWSPLWLAPLLAAQLLSARPGLSYRALFLSQRRSRAPEADATLDLRPVYLAAGTLAAGAAPAAGPPAGYLFGLLALSLWIVARYSDRRRHWPGWLGLLALTAALAYGAQWGLTAAQRQLEETAVAWLSAWFESDDPYRAQTALGDLGTLKLSDRVLYRVAADAPLLLRTATYNHYAGTTWFARERNFASVPRDGDGWRWAADDPAGTPARTVRIGGYTRRGGALLPLPTGAARIADLPTGNLSRHPLGAVKLGEGPPLVYYRAFHGDAALADRPPDDVDRWVPPAEQAVLRTLAATLQLDAADPAAAMQRVRDYFATHFRYTLELPGPTPGRTALQQFLLERRRGHCEFFASATVLLLRAAGVPARYAVGYAVQEREPGAAPGSWLVRRSHAHAWTLVWHQDRWRELDTTPALWAELEAARRPFWQPAADLVSRLWYAFNLSRIDSGASPRQYWLWGLLAILSALLAHRLRLGPRFVARRAARRRLRPAPSDSPLAGIARTLTRAGWPRRPGETDRHWLTRLHREPTLQARLPDPEALLRLHERARYHPAGLNPAEQRALRHELARWQARWTRAS